MIDFPTSPVLGDTYTFNGRSWTWNGSGWERLINQGQVVAVFVSPGVEVIETLQALPMVSLDWATLNYV